MIPTQVKVQAYDAKGNLSSKYVYLDLIGFDKSGNLNAYDFKLSVNSPLQSNQSLLYPDLARFGGVVTGYKGGNIVPKNTVLQPLLVNIDYLVPKPKN